MGEDHVSMAVLGCNFTTGAKVKFNGVDRMTTAAGDNQLNVALLASDFVAAGNIAVSVQNPAAQADAKPGEPKKEPTPPLMSNAKNLRVKAGSDMKVAWDPYGVEKKEITLEVRLILLVLFAGAFSSAVFGLNSFVNYAGEDKLLARWHWLYYARPVIGAGMALIFYLVVRAGFLAGSTADAKAVNPFGFVAIASLVAMFSDSAIMKLNEIFDTLFNAKDTRSDGLTELSITPKKLRAKVNTAFKETLRAKGGTPPYTWSAKAPHGWLTLNDEGELTGTAPGTPHTDVFMVLVKDHKGKTAEEEFTIEVTT
jgi:hypothetical protein